MKNIFSSVLAFAIVFGLWGAPLVQPRRVFLPAKAGVYDVTVVFGDRDATTRNWVKAEGQRVMLGEVSTDAGRFSTNVFTVAVRNRAMPSGGCVSPVNEDGTRMLWDDRLHIDVFTEGAAAPEPQVERAADEDTVRIFVTGDSTVCDTSEELWLGWGAMLPQFFEKGVAVANYAQSGGTLTSFRFSGRFAKMLDEARSGDYFLVQYMHNDASERGAEAGAFNGYYRRLKEIVECAKAKGLKVAVVSAQERRRLAKDGTFARTLGDYPKAAKAVADATGAAFIDLTESSFRLYQSLGPEGTKRIFRFAEKGEYPYFPDARSDGTHFKELGAYAIARLVLNGMRESWPEISVRVRPRFGAFNPDDPDLSAVFPPTVGCIDLFGSTRSRVGLWGGDCAGVAGFGDDPVKTVGLFQSLSMPANLIALPVKVAANGAFVVDGSRDIPVAEVLKAVRVSGCTPPKVLLRAESSVRDRLRSEIESIGESGRVFVEGTDGCPYEIFSDMPNKMQIAKAKAKGHKIVLASDGYEYENSEDVFFAGVDLILTAEFPSFRSYNPSKYDITRGKSCFDRKETARR